jgi:hypothetical protein
MQFENFDMISCKMKQKKILSLYVLLLLLLAYSASAKEITIAVNQTEYYFLTGQDAVVPFEFENTYGKQIDGTISYTITQEVNQGGMHMSSSNSQSQSFSVKDGNEVMNFGFGKSDSPVTLRVNMEFNYNDNEDKVVSLDELLIHFVNDPSQQQNQQNRQESKSEERESQQNQQQQQSMMQQMQEQLQEMFNNQEPRQQTLQDRVQNNQMAQDSSALKEQMQKQLQKQQQNREELKKQIEQNEEFQEKHKELTKQGFSQTNANIDPINSTTGSFEVNYEKDGEKATLKGDIENGEVKNLEHTISSSREKAMDILGNNTQYKEFNEELLKEGFKAEKPIVNQDANTTTVQIDYINEKNETATISAKIEDQEVKEVKLERDKNNHWWLLIVLVLLMVTSYLAYKRYKNLKKQTEPEQPKPVEKPIDYKKEALKMLDESKKLFQSQKEKDAYGMAACAIRFYYSYKFGLKKEITNSEMITVLKKKKVKFESTQDCLNLCGLVEFAKYKANKKDFDEIVKLAEKVIRP